MKITLLVLAFLFSFTKLYTQIEERSEIEITVFNFSGDQVAFMLYPVSMVFNNDYEYNLVAKSREINSEPIFYYNNGVSEYTDFWSHGGLHNSHFSGSVPIYFNNDADDQHGGFHGAHGSFGYGLYKLDILPYNSGFLGSPLDSCLIEIDNFDRYNTPGDLTIFWNGINATHKIMYQFSSHASYNISPTHDTIQWWKPDGPTGMQNKRIGNFVFDEGSEFTPNIYNVMPLDSRRDCNILIGSPWLFHSQNHQFPFLWISGEANDNRGGTLIQNLTIKKNVTTPSVLVDGDKIYTKDITVSNSVYLKLDNNKQFTMIAYPNTTNNVTMTVKGRPGNLGPSSGLLWLANNSTFRIKTNSVLKLEPYSRLLLQPGSQLIREAGGFICNAGAQINGSGSLILQGKQPYGGPCAIITPNWVIQDSVKMILSDSASLVLPDSTTITFEGNESALIMNSCSEIKFGKGSKLIFKNGSRISANGCKFTSLDSTDTWNGIYIENSAHDTIKNCIIENAYDGININYSVFSTIFTNTTQITGCNFRNTTTTQLLNAVYVNSAFNTLIKDCNISSSGTGGFSAGIMAEYCAAGELIVCDNTVNNCITGLGFIQSSPYVARNVITGSTDAGSGIYLDNSNGTVEYNRVHNFLKSVELQYSSPYMLKNTFSDAASILLAIKYSSIPVLRPVISSSSLRWLGGNNYFTGSPTEGAMTFLTGCYPLMDSGYNVVNVNGYDYLSGSLKHNIYATLNNWYDDPPNTQLFDLTGGTVYYLPTFDGTTLPSTNGSELNPLGFELYDTVYTNSFDNPTPQDLFMQAYNHEAAGEYSDAITDYKEVVEGYSTSSFAAVSLSRIFNCMEKAGSSSSAYQSIQSFFAAVKADTLNPIESRELAEDFEIKSKVRRGLLETAISDYNNLYQNNLYNDKGQHALLNKLCLEAMISEGDNMLNNSSSLQSYKTSLLSLINGRLSSQSSITGNITPSSYKLHQNYPNPFNPVTIIKYDIPTNSNVTVEIYDLLGREIFSVNEFKTAGSYEIRFDGSNYASGMYFYSFEANGYKETKKMVLIK